MNSPTTTKTENTKQTSANVDISGPGVIRVRSSEVVKTKEAKRQIDAYERLRESGRL